jgi:hypothetical protein
VGALTGAGIDFAIQLLENGGNLDCIDWGSVGDSALAGAAFSGLGPTGFLLGRGGAQASRYGYNKAPGILNGGNTRFGWSGPTKSSSDALSYRVGKQHNDLRGIRIPSGGAPVRDGIVSGVVVSPAVGGGCGCK